MIEHTLEEIEKRVRGTLGIADPKKQELLTLLASLKKEIGELSKIQNEHAESIAGFVERSTHEATRREKNPTLLKLAIEGLSASVKGFEDSHPKLVEDVSYICTMLSNMGL